MATMCATIMWGVGACGEGFSRLWIHFHESSLAMVALFSILEPDWSFQNSIPHPELFCYIFWNIWFPLMLIIVSKSLMWVKGSAVFGLDQSYLSPRPLCSSWSNYIYSLSHWNVPVYFLSEKSLYIQFILLRCSFPFLPTWFLLMLYI